ncbi:MAG: transcription elongation factor GreA [Chloroflexi bacterium]|nr:MAG: transcription elongation factor GreA [Chloroflexota bacterium]
MIQENNYVYVTEEGLQKLKDELDQLTKVKREEVAIKLQTAIAQGDLKENADYHAAKEEQGFIEMRVKDIEDSLRRIKIIEDAGPSDVVRVGSTVTVFDEEFEEEETYYIVGAHEADPSNGRISNESPYGQALLGAKKGQYVTVQTPGGQVRLQVTGIK